jgi:hypothetical protein
MARLYTEDEISAILRTLRIAPEKGKLNAEEAARVLSWRAKEEQGLDYEYQADAIRQHVRYKHFEEGSIDPKIRGSRYPVEQVFKLPLAPKRRLGRKQPEQGSSAENAA